MFIGTRLASFGSVVRLALVDHDFGSAAGAAGAAVPAEHSDVASA